MEIVIKIPEEEFGIEIDDKFQDFFKRLKVEIKEHLITNTSLLCGAYELETVDMLLKAFNSSTSLPKGHGRLIDADYKVSSDGRTIDAVCGYIAPTIIEADKESEEE